MQIGSPVSLVAGVLANGQMKRYEAAERMLRNTPADTPLHLREGLRAYILASSGRKEAARDVLSALVKRVPPGTEPLPMVVPVAYAALGEPQLAVEWISESGQTGDFLGEWRLIPEIRALASDPKMREMLHKFGFPE
jgi:hypothetical protein